jgi:nitrilase
MRIAVIQMNQGSDKAANIAQARALIDGAVAADRPDMVSLPETWTNLGGGRDGRFAAAEVLPEPGGAGGAAYEFLREVARANRIHVHGGSIIERGGIEAGGGKLFNTSLLFDPDGREVARYRKIHLFDITAPDGTGYRESALYGAGTALVCAEAGGVTWGLTVCYDMRFAEQFVALRAMGAEAILVPSNFTLQTGKDHWEVLLRARAIETQCWIVAAASHGAYEERGATRQVYGHSLICDPWGHVVAKCSDGTGWATARIDPAVTARVRRDMPVLEHRAARRVDALDAARRVDALDAARRVDALDAARRVDALDAARRVDGLS